MTRGKKSKTTKAGPPKNVTVSTRERQANYVETLLENKRFEEYYRNMGILNDRDFDIFMNALRLPLPVSFRITGSKQHATQLRDYMRNSLFPKLSNVVVDGKAIPPPETVDWYPDELAFVYDIGRGALKKCEAAQELHKFLVAENEVGNICRQEIVSMIPVRFLDVRPSQSILDMCAAPGSKTTQLLEGIMTESNEFPDGIVIANDSDQKRAYTLVHQAKRLQTPTLLVTNHDAQVFPRILVKSDRAEKSALLFDRVLCDVPCSGDGTMRKNKAIWKSWQANNGLGLHRTQRNILLRGLELLKVDGLLVYSTCSFNPVENEAVIASVLEETGDCFELVDIGEQLPTLKRYPGISTWKVLSNDGTFNLEYAPNLPGIQKTMFPPKNIENFGMDRCMRFYPFLFNGGGFFVAVIRKKKEFGKVDNFNTTQITKSAKRKHYLSENTKEDFDVRNFKVGNRTELINGEAPFVWAPADTKAVKGCIEEYGLQNSFPLNQFFVRTFDLNEDFASIYVVSKKVKEVLTSTNSKGLRVVNAGIKLFVKNGGKDFAACPYRVCSEGVQTISSHLSPIRQIRIPLSDLLVMIRHDYPKFSEFSEETAKSLANLPRGSCILFCDPETEESLKGRVKGMLVFPFFRANVSVSMLINKKESNSLLHRLTEH